MCGRTHSNSNTLMQVGSESGTFDAHLVGAHDKIGRSEETLVIAINSASLVPFDLPQTNYHSWDSPSGGVTNRPLQRSASLRCLGH